MEQKYLFSKTIPYTIRRAMYKRMVFFEETERGSLSVSPEIRELAQEPVLFLSTRVVPTCLSLKAVRSDSVKKNAQMLLSAGFPLEKYNPEVRRYEHVFAADSDWDNGTSVSKILSNSTGFSSLIDENVIHEFRKSRDDFANLPLIEEETAKSESEGESPDSDFESTSELTDEDPEYRPDLTGDIRIEQSDPFKVVAALEFAHRSGCKEPVVRCWNGDQHNLTSDIPVYLLGKGWTGRSKKGKPFQAIASVEVKMRLICKHTYWGAKLVKYVRGEDAGMRVFATHLLKTIKRYLEGDQPPGLQKKFREDYFGTEKSKPKSRSARFIQILQTIDGVFQQKYLAVPEAAWSWDQYDNFVIGLLHMLIMEEFADGTLTDEVIRSAKSVYATIKSTRQSFKDAANRKDMETFLVQLFKRKDPVERVFYFEYEYYSRQKDRVRSLAIRGVLGQTRGAGTPPPVVVMRTKIKFLDTITNPPVALTSFQKGFIRTSFERILEETPDDAFTGLQTKAGVTVSTSACYERTRKEGGTAGAIAEMVSEGNLGRCCNIIDLNNGEFVQEKSLEETTPGEYIFWRCLEEVLATDIKELRRVSLVVVQEPGKARSVTKANFALKIVLDLVNGICSYPLGKAFASSTSGMGKEAHGWNFFKSLIGDQEKLFRIKSKKTQSRTVGVIEEIDTFETVFVSSTDYETATDFMSHEVARIVGDGWMRKCGIPPILRGIVHGTCYTSREVEFRAEGPLREIGTAVKDKQDIRYVVLRRGVLMGDPLTKVVLHLINIMVRNSAQFIANNCMDDRTGTYSLAAMRARRAVDVSRLRG